MAKLNATGGSFFAGHLGVICLALTGNIEVDATASEWFIVSSILGTNAPGFVSGQHTKENRADHVVANFQTD